MNGLVRSGWSTSAAVRRLAVLVLAIILAAAVLWFRPGPDAMPGRRPGLTLEPAAAGTRSCSPRAQVHKPRSTTRPLLVRKAVRKHRRIVLRAARRIRFRGQRRVGVSVRCYLMGGASWYGEEFRGRTTACGEAYNPDRLTAAHRTLPCDTRLVVWHRGRSVRVRVNDRGPFVEGRILDLSRAAFARLADTGRGVIDVEARRA